MMRVIPAIDMRGGKCVRLFQGEFDRQTEYSSDPLAVARTFEGLGCPDLHLVDLDGAQSGEQKNHEFVRRIAAATGFDIQLGGGIRDERSVQSWLDAGVSRCVIGSLAVTAPDTVGAWISRFGADRIVLALDVRLDANDEPMLATHGWTEETAVTLWDCVAGYRPLGLKYVLCTDISRDGALGGPNTDLYREFTSRFPEVRLQASGGVRHVDDLRALRDTGADAAITGRALLDGRITAEEIGSFQRSA
jgi:phosphoribosylformimino-5-aminoimidazole carboxamide ribotide isomerase